MSSLGIDISAWQTDVNFERVKKAGREFVIVRAGAGKTIDPLFDAHAAGALAAGLKLGAYWFSYAASVKEAQEEADLCARTICEHDITYPVAFDFEDASLKNAQKKGVCVTKALLTDMALAFAGRISLYGYTPLIYANPYYLKQYYDQTRLKDVGIWLAYWQKSDPPAQDLSASCAIWQYAVAGKGSGTTVAGGVDGVAGNVDVDVCYADYTRSRPIDGVYQTVQQLPRELRREITGLIASGALRGTGKGLELTLPMARSLVVAKRYTDCAAGKSAGKEG